MIEGRLEECLKDTAGICAVMVRNLQTGEAFAHNENVVFPAASVVLHSVWRLIGYWRE